MKKFCFFILKCAALCGVTLCLLFLLDYRYRQVRGNPYADADKFQFMDSDNKKIQICNFGSSHGESSFRYEELAEKSGYECFNFAMASQTFNYDYAIMSMYEEHFAERCVMFLPVSYFSFNNEVTNATDMKALNAKYYTFLSPKYVPGYEPYIDIVTHHIPILSAEEDMMKLLPILPSFMPTAKNPAASSPTLQDFHKKAKSRYHRHMDNKKEYFLPERIKNLYDILRFCKERQITAILITTPYMSCYSDLFPAEFKQEFYQTIHLISEKTGTPYYDYSEDERFSLKTEYFSDADHLNTKGAIYFMEVIEAEIPEFKMILSDKQYAGGNDRDNGN